MFDLIGSGMLVFLIALVLVDFVKQKCVTKSALLGRVVVIVIALLALLRT